ncbi:uncharacterized protein LOC142898626 [Nelusetta ayraudi]|uniref:uncharacterized protein LOC142898626 n=1 Tax=Nelusetta ayraudi TaxID=303726 RepID=UPI003F72C37E
MQAFVPRTRLYLTPVRDEEAESQRKAKSRHARQTRRSTQGVTLTELKEAKRTNNLPPPDRHTEEGASPEKGCCVMKGLTDDRGAQITEDTDEINKEKEIMDEQGNAYPKLDTLTECSISTLPYSSNIGSCGPSYCNTSFGVGSRWWKDENQNLIEGAAEQNTSNPKLPQRRYCCEAVQGSDYNAAEVWRDHTPSLFCCCF